MTVKKLPDRIECPECDGLMYFWDELRDYKYCAKCGYHEGKKLEDVLKEKPVKAQDTITKKVQEQING